MVSAAFQGDRKEFRVIEKAQAYGFEAQAYVQTQMC